METDKIFFYFSFPDDVNLQKIVTYAHENGMITAQYMTSEERYKLWQYTNYLKFTKGAVELGNANYIRGEVRTAKRYGMRVQMSNILMRNWATFYMRKGVPWAKEYKNIIL